MPTSNPPKKVPTAPEEHATREAAKKPGPSDVHEQRQSNQTAEGVVQKTKEPRPPSQSLIDQERGDWEGMGQSKHTPD